MDGAGANRVLQKRSGIQFEYTARSTPQQNSLVEVRFATLTNRTRAVVYHANIPDKLKHRTYKSAAEYVTNMDRLVMCDLKGVIKTP